MTGVREGRSAGCRQPAAVAMLAFAAAMLLMAAAPALAQHDPTDECNCNRCHACAKPTAADPCLREPCTRGYQLQAAGKAAHDAVPDSMLLDVLAKDYEPVPFNHRAHADMAGMAQGCATCHHHSEAGAPPPACITCHDPRVEGTDPRMPGLKGAYHQQCLNCHREWMDESACSICHLPRARASAGGAKAHQPTSGDILGRMHPPIPAPASDYYSRRGASGDLVLFRHKDHVERFGLACIDCHHEPSCARCHAEANTARAAECVHEHHRPCLTCHADEMDLAGGKDSCARCHLGKDGRAPARFQHETVGWPLASYHARLDCRDCHRKVPYTRLATSCTSCHQGWETGRFDHQVTGQSLDENHADLACADCHKEGRYELPPDCTDCHALGDGVEFPAQRPGPQR
jgi:hypothetical protein